MNDSLPGRMRQLIQYLNQEVIERTHRIVRNAEERRKSKLNKLQAVSEAAARELAQARQKLETQFEREKSEIQRQSDWVIQESASLLNRSQSLLASAQKHMKDNLSGVSEHQPLFGFASGLNASDAIAKAKSEIIQAENILAMLQETKIDGEVFKPTDLGYLGLGIAFVLAIMLSSTIGGGWAAILFWLMLGYGGICMIRFLYRLSILKGHYSRLSLILSNIDAELAHQLEGARADNLAQTQNATASYEAQLRSLHSLEKQKKAEHEQMRSAIHQRYYQALQHCEEAFATTAEQSRTLCKQFREMTGYVGAHWDEAVWQAWTPANSPAFVASFGTLEPETEDLKEIFPSLDLAFPVPALIPFADGKCLLLKASGEAMAQAARCLQSVMLRLLATIPPGKVNFILIDPVGLGKNVAAMMKLAEYEESLIKSRAWTEPQHIEQRLAELTEHMETVIQKYLRTDYASIEDYNRDAKKVAEPYRMLVVMDFPVNFTDTAAKRLVSIAQNGPRCGVYTLIMMNTSKPTPHGFNPVELEQHSFVISHNGNSFVWQDPEFETCHLTLDQPPDNSLSNKIIEKVGEQAKEAMKVEVPFTELLADAGLGKDRWWRAEAARNLTVPLGPTGARKQQMLTFGEGLTHHGLIVGRPGSGKTNLMHVIITTLSLAYSPDELQVYLVDFKKGVGFKPYADYKLPHAIAIAIESEREFGLSVLQGLDAKMQRRGELFRSVSVEDISEYRRKTGNKMPRLLLVADEFQEFFTHNDNIRTQSEILLDRLTRQGRAFGIHVLLGTQTLQGQNTMPKAIMNQIAVRIALQCSEEDSRIVLSHDNPAARLLSRPGEAIYNAANGLVEGNNLFQVARFTDEDRTQHLKAIAEMAGKNANEPIIFEGNEPARPETARALNELVSQPSPAVRPKAADAWLGEPTAIRPPVRARLRRQGGSNLLIVSRDEAEGAEMIFSALLSLAAQHTSAQAQFYVVNLATADSEWFELPNQLAELLPHKVKVIGRKYLPDLLKDLSGEMNRRLRESVGDAPTVFLMIVGLQRARDLRDDESDHGDDGVSAHELFISLLREGPETGIHTVVWCDSLANALRVVPRRQLREFGLRAATVMSMEDSQTLFDDGAAAKLDKPHRAIFYDDERPGVFDKFRPYGLPSLGWLQQAAARLRDRARSQ